jgi:hypothetical protein
MTEFLILVALWCSVPSGSWLRPSEVDKCRAEAMKCTTNTTRGGAELRDCFSAIKLGAK